MSKFIHKIKRILGIRPSEKRLIHDWFELSYCAYLTLPRSILQSMPEEFQVKLVNLLDELDSLYTCPLSGHYEVRVRDTKGRLVSDEFQDYQRGRRYVAPNQADVARERAISKSPLGKQFILRTAKDGKSFLPAEEINSSEATK